MVVPDFELIAEIMLVAEGFINARILARKFLTLYTLCKVCVCVCVCVCVSIPHFLFPPFFLSRPPPPSPQDLLSKQGHYDWGLRAIKSVLVVAGSLKRGDRGRPEDQVNGEGVRA